MSALSRQRAAESAGVLDWRPIPGFPSYEASSLGAIRRAPNSKWRNSKKTGALRESRPRSGRQPYVWACENGKARGVLVAELVALAFVGLRPSPKHRAVHLDGNINNNAASNVSWSVPPRTGPHTHPLYETWRAMHKRCTRPCTNSFDRYGGRGIKVCERWNDFEAFVSDVGERPSADHQLDRRDNDGDYEPANVRWVARHVQQRNKANNRWITHAGETLCITDWSLRTGLTRHCIHNRIESGWTPALALTRPSHKGKRP
jgi:hypothetical protein